MLKFPRIARDLEVDHVLPPSRCEIGVVWMCGKEIECRMVMIPLPGRDCQEAFWVANHQLHGGKIAFLSFCGLSRSRALVFGDRDPVVSMFLQVMRIWDRQTDRVRAWLQELDDFLRVLHYLEEHTIRLVKVMINRHCKETVSYYVYMYTYTYIYFIWRWFISDCTCDQFSDRSPSFLVPIHQMVHFMWVAATSNTSWVQP